MLPGSTRVKPAADLGVHKAELPDLSRQRSSAMPF